MLLYKQGRFYSGAISFALPDNSYLVIAEALNYHENGLEITDKYASFSLSISTYYEEMSAKEFLNDLLTGTNYKRLMDTTPIKAGEIDGYYVMYHDKRNSYCEYHFDLEETDDINSLVVIVQTELGRNIHDICRSKIVTELLESLKLSSVF